MVVSDNHSDNHWPTVTSVNWSVSKEKRNWDDTDTFPATWHCSAQFLQEKRLGILKGQWLEKCLISITRWFCLVLCARQVSLDVLPHLPVWFLLSCHLVKLWCPMPAAAGYTWLSPGAVGAARHRMCWAIQNSPSPFHCPVRGQSLLLHRQSSSLKDRKRSRFDVHSWGKEPTEKEKRQPKVTLACQL